MIKTVCVLVSGLAGVIAAIVVFPRAWRGDPVFYRNIESRVSGWWPFGEAVFRGWLRASPVAVTVFVLMYVGFLATLLM